MQEVTTAIIPAATTEKRLRGFAAMSPEKKKEIASMGGRAAHACGRAHQFTSEEGRAAGKKRHQPSDRPA
ncbi:KGG domain-containing protein [Caenimonas sp. SL110]|uniref:KGG domain-containing protein n=1 Tax=Caenimonas sp. SL110 TaxID=1450524 RepID=UPI0006534E5B|nr:KGG domain-containing protein [Caenimonas sp. SL110]